MNVIGIKAVDIWAARWSPRIVVPNLRVKSPSRGHKTNVRGREMINRRGNPHNPAKGRKAESHMRKAIFPHLLL